MRDVIGIDIVPSRDGRLAEPAKVRRDDPVARWPALSALRVGAHMRGSVTPECRRTTADPLPESSCASNRSWAPEGLSVVSP